MQLKLWQEESSFYSMIASDSVIAWGEVNIILSACMKENARAT